MQDDHKNLDQFFAESLKGFRQKPPVHSWQRIEEDLLAARRHRRLVLYRWTAAAAVLLIALMAGYYITTITPDHQPQDQTLSETQAPVTDLPSQSAVPEKDITNNIPAESTQTRISPPTEQPSEMISGTTVRQDASSVAVEDEEQEIIAIQLSYDIPTDTQLTDEVQ